MEYQVVILAGGQGVRLRPYTLERPKPLLDVHGKTILDLTLKPLVDFGIKKFVIAASYKVEMIEQFLREKYPELDVSFIDEPKPAGKSGTIRLGIEQGKLDPNRMSIITHADDIIKVDMGKLIEHHKNSGAEATLVLSKEFTNPFGVINYEGSKILSFEEKPQMGLPEGKGISCGMYVFSNLKSFENVNIPSNTEEVVFPRLSEAGKLSCFFADSWKPINTKAEYHKLIEETK